jgi:hypothetical protein
MANHQRLVIAARGFPDLDLLIIFILGTGGDARRRLAVSMISPTTISMPM